MANFGSSSGRPTHLVGALGIVLFACECLLAPNFLSAQPLTADSVREMATAAMATPVDRVLVLLRQDAGQASNAVDPLILSQISIALGQNVVDAGPSPTGARVLQLSEPTQLGHLRELLGVLRQRADVVWAELDPQQRQSAMSGISQRMRSLGVKTLDSAAANVVQLMVTLADPGTQQASRQDELLGPEWDATLSQAALVPLHVAHATVGGAWIVQLPYPMNEAGATAVAVRLIASGVAKYADADLPVTTQGFPDSIPNDPGFLQGPQWALYDHLTTPYTE